MKSKREVLEIIAKYKGCSLSCYDCPYSKLNTGKETCIVKKLRGIGAMAILRMFPKESEFDTNKIFTCITADKAKVGMKGYFAYDLAGLREEFARNNIQTLIEIFNEDCYERFKTNSGLKCALFYPIDNGCGKFSVYEVEATIKSLENNEAVE